MSRKYVDNKMNRELGRVGLPVGSAVHSRSSPSYQSSSSSSHRAYVDNSMNRQLGRVGHEIGTAVHSRSETPRTYVDNTMNQQLGRVGMAYGTAVHSKSETPRTYVDNTMNQQLGRVGMAYGTAVHSKSETPRTYVDNTMNQQLGRVGMAYGTAVHSKSETPRTYVDNTMNQQLGRVGMAYGTAVHSKSETPRTYVDNTMNQQLGRVGMAYGTAVHSKSETPRTYVDNTMNQQLGRVGMAYGTAVHSKSETPRTYVDNTMNQQLGRVGMAYGTAVHSKSETPRTNVANTMNRELGRVGRAFGIPVNSSVESEKGVYVDNAFNRKHNRVGLPKGSVPVSRKNELYYQIHLNSKHQEASAANSNQKFGLTEQAQVKKVYVDNPFNRKHNRVGLPLGSVPISRNKEVYSDTALNRKLDRVGKSWGTTAAANKNKLASLYKHLEEHSDDGIPEEFESMSDDAFSYVLEFRQRQDAVRKFLEETACNNWQPHEHTSTETIQKYQGKIIDYEKLHIGDLIGHGGFGEVYFASLENGEAVAVKKLKSQQVTKKRLQLFKKEMDLFLKLDHRNIVSFIGACIEVPNLAIVMEYMDMSLFDALHVKEVDFTVNNKLEITDGVTNGLAYLHSQDIAHCDLKSKNVLLINVPGQDVEDRNKPVCAKITDFGLSKIKSDMVTSNSLSAVNIGTPLYSAPEIHQGQLLSLEGLKKADIFSMGLLIWELAVQEIPFEDLTLEQLKVQVGEKGLTPVSSENLKLDRKVQETLSLCWSMDPNKRPSAETMAEIASTFTNVLEEKEE